MDRYEVFAQAIGLLAMAMNVLSYQQKGQRRTIVFQLFGSLLFSVNYLMLGATMGAVLNLIGVIRAIIYMERDRFHAAHIAWFFGFSAVYILSYALTVTAFGNQSTSTNPIIELLPVIAMIVATFSYRYKEAKMIRRFGIVSSPLWLTYNIFNGSVGAILCEVLNLISITVGIVRFDIEKRKK